jgi:hypothetical protein
MLILTDCFGGSTSTSSPFHSLLYPLRITSYSTLLDEQLPTYPMKTILAALALLFGTSNGFAPPTTTQLLPCHQYRSSVQHAIEEGHPAVIGWPEKYREGGGDIQDETSGGPAILSTEFQIQKSSPSQLKELDVMHWPTWTTSDKPKWTVGNQVVDKEMPYGELSYVLSGKLEIIPQATGVPEIVNVGDFVTFPKGFVASWKVLEELTWHYYLY